MCLVECFAGGGTGFSCGVECDGVQSVAMAFFACRGMQCGGSASAVGEAATSAVVTSIVFIVTACGVLAVVFYIIGI